MDREELIREKAKERLAQIDEDVLKEMSIEAVKDKYNDIKAQVEQEMNSTNEMNDMFKDKDKATKEDTVKSK
ncbi:MAG: hypothetical protein IKH54_05280 [Bacilli bacterium]|nr:hypothetical protein [Bacilli bacterium]